MARKKLSKEKSLQRTKFYAQCIVCLAALGAGAFLIKGAADRSTIVSQSPYADDSELPDTTMEEAMTLLKKTILQMQEEGDI